MQRRTFLTTASATFALSILGIRKADSAAFSEWNYGNTSFYNNTLDNLWASSYRFIVVNLYNKSLNAVHNGEILMREGRALSFNCDIGAPNSRTPSGLFTIDSSKVSDVSYWSPIYFYNSYCIGSLGTPISLAENTNGSIILLKDDARILQEEHSANPFSCVLIGHAE
jgi:hypothetical protein